MPKQDLLPIQEDFNFASGSPILLMQGDRLGRAGKPGKIIAQKAHREPGVLFLKRCFLTMKRHRDEM